MSLHARPWKVRELVFSLFWLVASFIIAQEVLMALRNAAPLLISTPMHQAMLFFGTYCIMLLPLWFPKIRQRLPLGPVSFRALLVEPALLWLGSTLFLASLLWIFGPTLPGFTGEQVSFAQLPQDGVSLPLLLISAALLAPLAEECIFRGILLPGLLQWLRPVGAIGVNALLFAIMHQQGGVILPLTLVGIVTGFLTWRHGSLWPAVMFHILNNTIALWSDYAGLGL